MGRVLLTDPVAIEKLFEELDGVPNTEPSLILSLEIAFIAQDINATVLTDIPSVVEVIEKFNNVIKYMNFNSKIINIKLTSRTIDKIPFKTYNVVVDNKKMQHKIQAVIDELMFDGSDDSSIEYVVVKVHLILEKYRKENIGFICKQCGHCCKELTGAYENSVPDFDVDAWGTYKEDSHILKYISRIPIGILYDKKVVHVNDIWISPITRDYVNRCPWLRKNKNKNTFSCTINHIKPYHCRCWPYDAEQAKSAGCHGFDHLDAENNA